jgi:RND family efflux transporter MFP subunit
MKKKMIYAILGAIVLLIGWAIYKNATKQPTYVLAEVKKMNLQQEVSVTGHVKAAQSADLAFERSGKTARVDVKIGDKVWPGKKLAELENGELLASLTQAQANLEVEQARLSEMQKGTRPEEIAIAETALINAQNDAAAAIQKVYDAGITAASEAVVYGKNALLTLSDLQFKYFTGNDQDSSNIATAKKTAVLVLLGLDNAGRLSSEEISKLDGGAFGLVQTATANPTLDDIDNALAQTSDALQKTKLALDAIKITTSFTDTEKTNLSAAKINIGAEITAVSAKIQAIVTQKTTGENNVAAAESNLQLQRAGSTPEQLTAEEARVKSLEAAVQNAQAQLLKTIIFSPIAGIVTKQELKVGEIAPASITVISVISEKQFEVEANVAEADIAKIKIGNTANVTLDAYGSDVVFDAQVVKIDPAETIIDGVPTYKITLQFGKEDSRIKSGMTANLDILTDKRENVLAMPNRAIIGKNGGKGARILVNGILTEVNIKIGMRGVDGNVEILDGLKEGDQVIVEIKK